MVSKKGRYRPPRGIDVGDEAERVAAIMDRIRNGRDKEEQPAQPPDPTMNFPEGTQYIPLSEKYGSTHVLGRRLPEGNRYAWGQLVHAVGNIATSQGLSTVRHPATGDDIFIPVTFISHRTAEQLGDAWPTALQAIHKSLNRPETASAYYRGLVLAPKRGGAYLTANLSSATIRDDRHTVAEILKPAGINMLESPTGTTNISLVRFRHRLPEHVVPQVLRTKVAGFPQENTDVIFGPIEVLNLDELQQVIIPPQPTADPIQPQ